MTSQISVQLSTTTFTMPLPFRVFGYGWYRNTKGQKKCVISLFPTNWFCHSMWHSTTSSYNWHKKTATHFSQFPYYLAYTCSRKKIGKRKDISKRTKLLAISENKKQLTVESDNFLFLTVSNGYQHATERIRQVSAVHSNCNTWCGLSQKWCIGHNFFSVPCRFQRKHAAPVFVCIHYTLFERF